MMIKTRLTLPVIKKAALISLAVILPAIALLLFAGADILPVYALSVGVGMSVTTAIKGRPVVFLGLVLVGAFGLAAMFHKNIMILPLLVAAMGALSITANRLSVGLCSLAPSGVAVVGMVSGAEPYAAIIVAAAGFLYAGVVTRFAHLSINPKPVPARVALTHGVTLALLTGAATWAALHWNLPHGYWLVVTIAMVLRPQPEETLTYIGERAAGTLSGALIALLVLFLLPSWLVLPAVLVCMVLYISYVLLGGYAVQVFYMTIVLLLSVASGNKNVGLALAAERILWTFVAVAATAITYGSILTTQKHLKKTHISGVRTGH